MKFSKERKLCLAFEIAFATASAQSTTRVGTKFRANAWYDQQPWLVGANYVPSDAINELEMFQVQHACQFVPGVFNLASGPPSAAFPVANGGLMPLPNNISAAARPHRQTLPVVYAYNATIQRQLTDKISVSAAYVGNSGRHAPNDVDSNINANQAAFVPGVTNQNTLKPYFAKYGWTQSTTYFCNCAVSQYNALQASVDVWNYHGYSVQGTYVYHYARTPNLLSNKCEAVAELHQKLSQVEK